MMVLFLSIERRKSGLIMFHSALRDLTFVKLSSTCSSVNLLFIGSVTVDLSICVYVFPKHLW